MNLAEIRSRVRENLDDPTGSEWDDSRLDRIINEAYTEVQSIAETADPSIMNRRWDSGTMPLDFSDSFRPQTETVLPEDFRRIRTVSLSFNSAAFQKAQPIPLRAITYYLDLDQHVYYIRHAHGSRVLSPQEPLVSTDVATLSEEGGRSYIGFPAGYASLSSATIRVIVSYFAKPISLVFGGDGEQVLSLPDEHHHIVVAGATVKALLQDNEPVAAGYKKLYDKSLAAMKAVLVRRDGQAA